VGRLAFLRLQERTPLATIRECSRGFATACTSVGIYRRWLTIEQTVLASCNGTRYACNALQVRYRFASKPLQAPSMGLRARLRKPGGCDSDATGMRRDADGWQRALNELLNRR
jgi:hypothetical protein